MNIIDTDELIKTIQRAKSEGYQVESRAGTLYVFNDEVDINIEDYYEELE